MTLRGISFSFIFFSLLLAGNSAFAEYREYTLNCEGVACSADYIDWGNLADVDLRSKTIIPNDGNVVETSINGTLELNSNGSIECFDFNPFTTDGAITSVGVGVNKYSSDDGDRFNFKIYEGYGCSGTVLSNTENITGNNYNAGLGFIGQSPISEFEYQNVNVPTLANTGYSFSVQFIGTHTTWVSLFCGTTCIDRSYVVVVYGETAPITPSTTCEQAVCTNITDVLGCVQVALCWAFVPENTPDWSGLGKEIGKKPPFGYLTVLKNGIAGISASGTPSFTLVSNTTKNDFSGIFTPVRNGFIVIFWFGGALWLFTRAKNFTV